MQRELTAEQAALRRIATLVASETVSTRVFEQVTVEAAQTLGASAASLARFDPDDTVTFIGAWSRDRRARVPGRLECEPRRGWSPRRGSGDGRAATDSPLPGSCGADRRAHDELWLRLRRRRTDQARRGGLGRARRGRRARRTVPPVRSAGSRTSPSSSRTRWRTRTHTGSSRSHERESSRRPTASAAGWSATCTTARSNGSSRSRSSSGSSDSAADETRAAESLLTEADDELQHALEELRELARGSTRPRSRPRTLNRPRRTRHARPSPSGHRIPESACRNRRGGHLLPRRRGDHERREIRASDAAQALPSNDRTARHGGRARRRHRRREPGGSDSSVSRTASRRSAAGSTSRARPAKAHRLTAEIPMPDEAEAIDL